LENESLILAFGQPNRRAKKVKSEVLNFSPYYHLAPPRLKMVLDDKKTLSTLHTKTYIALIRYH
jgi:hypothetical protein